MDEILRCGHSHETSPVVPLQLTEHKRTTRNGDVNNLIAEQLLQTKHQIDWDSVTCIMYSTDYYQRLTLESWFTNLEQKLLNRNQQFLAPFRRLIDKIKRMTGELTIWLTMDGCLTATIDGSKCNNYITSLHSQLHHGLTDRWPTTCHDVIDQSGQCIIPSTDAIQLTLTLGMTTTQVVETSVTVNNNSPIQDYIHPDDQTQPTLEMTPEFKPFTVQFKHCNNHFGIQ